MRPLYIAGTTRDVGKTTLSLGLLHSFRERGLRVAYTKPLGQRTTTVDDHRLHDDAMVVSRLLGDEGGKPAEMVIPLGKGRVEKEVFDLKPSDQMAKIQATCAELAEQNDILIVESMGHVAMGSCLGLSSAHVVKGIGARALLISGGGIGRAIDDIALCKAFLISHGTEMLGAIVNKVWRQKYTRVMKATTQGLANLGIRSLGTVPYEEQLLCPTMQQVLDLMKGDLISGAGSLRNVISHTIVAAMAPDHMIDHLRPGTLIITPGANRANIEAALKAHMLSRDTESLVAGLILTGGFESDEESVTAFSAVGVPVIVVKEDTYRVASKFHETVFKITPEDGDKINAAICLVAEYVDVDGILEGLTD